MRNIILCILFPLSVFAQGVYYPMLHNSKWIVKSPTQFKVRETIGDTIIQGHAYAVIKSATYGLSDIHLLSPTLIPGYTYLREDSLTQTVYKWNTVSEDLIYNYTWTSGFHQCPFSPNIFFLPNTTTINTGVRKVLQFVDGIPPTTGFDWIESVGSLLDPIENCYANTKLLCNYQNGVLNYDNGTTSGINCSLLNQAHLIQNELLFSIYPNPSNNGIFRIQLKNEMELESLNVVVSDAYGQIVFQVNPIKDRTFYFTLEPNGIYFLRLSDGTKQVSRKIVVMN
jgi:hypothetical protein